MIDPFENATQPPSKKDRAWKVTKAVFLTKFNSNILTFVIVIAITLAGYHLIVRDPGITGNVIIEQNMSCPEVACPACIQQECKQDCSLCVTKTKVEEIEAVKIRCSDGTLINEGQECSINFPEVDAKTSGTVSGITLSIDKVDFERDEGNNGFINSVEYTIINRADYPIVPRIEVKVYQQWSSQVRNSDANKNLKIETVVNPNSYVQRVDSARIYFRGSQQKVRLLLIDTLPDRDEEIVAVVKEIELE